MIDQRTPSARVAGRAGVFAIVHHRRFSGVVGVVEVAVLVVLLVAAAVFGVGCPGGNTPDAGAVAVVTATKGDLVFRSSYYGEIEAKQAHPIFVPELKNLWQVTVESVLPDGTAVKQGDTVLTFARGSLEADLRDRETELAVAEANQKKVTADYDDQKINRALALRRSELAAELAQMNVVEGVNLISRIELEKAKVELTRAQLQVELDRGEVAVLEQKRAAALEAERVNVAAARQKVADVKAQLGKMTVQAPASGMLFAPYTRLNWVMSKVAPGRVVRPGDKLLEIPGLDAFRASVFVRQRDASNIKVGDEAVVVPTMFPDLQLKGVVVSRDEFATTRNERSGATSTGGTLKELRVVLDLVADADVQARYASLRPGGTVRADVTTTLAREVVLLPLGALREQGDGFVVVDAAGTERRVGVGQTSLTHAEITSGVAAGDVVRLLERSQADDRRFKDSAEDKGAGRKPRGDGAGRRRPGAGGPPVGAEP
jgi:multidrug resistance efflux pump